MNYFDLTGNQIEVLMESHNTFVKEEYVVTNRTWFLNWLADNWNSEEDYIEISANETISGNSIILEIWNMWILVN